MQEKVTFEMQQTKEILDFMLAFGHGLEAVRADGEYSMDDIMKMWPAIEAIIPAISDSGEVVLEFQMADKEALTTLANYVRDNLELGDKSTEAFIEESVYLLVNLFLFIKKYFLKEDEVAVPTDTKEVSEVGQGALTTEDEPKLIVDDDL